MSWVDRHNFSQDYPQFETTRAYDHWQNRRDETVSSERSMEELLETTTKQGGRLPMTLKELATRLGRVNRFAGAGRYPYSVLQHSLTVGFLAIRDGLTAHDTAQAFLHDAHEAVTGDVVGNHKTEMQRHHEGMIQREVLEDLGIRASRAAPFYLEEKIKELDTLAGDAEAVELLRPNEYDPRVVDVIDDFALRLTKNWHLQTAESLEAFFVLILEPFVGNHS